jgi:broad specificity polyphosphatase/5'/3'-nucleotidase SurE
MEAAYLDVPAIAVSSVSRDPPNQEYRRIGRSVTDLLKYSFRNDVFSSVDYLNVNYRSTDDQSMELTYPESTFRFTARKANPRNVFEFGLSERQLSAEKSVSHEEFQSDRQAVKRGATSVSPLAIPHNPVNKSLLEDYSGM